MVGIIREILFNVLSTFCGGDNKVQERHELVEAFWDKRGRLFSMVPFIVILSVAATDMVAAIWTAFSVQVFLNLMDYYRSRYNPHVPFPTILNVAFLLGYIIVIILYYTLFPPLSSVYVSPIVVTSVFTAMLLSLIFQYPFTMQMSASRVDEETRKSDKFYKLNQVVTGFWVVIMAFTMVSAWCATLYPVGTPGQIVLGIVLPILFPVIGHLVTPAFVEYLKSKAEKDKKDEESANLIEKA